LKPSQGFHYRKCPTRLPGGARKIPLTVASFRIWRGLEVSAAPDPAGQSDSTRVATESQYSATILNIDMLENRVFNNTDWSVYFICKNEASRQRAK
jgi:hypothetical protein